MFDMAEYMDGETFCYVGITLVIAVSVYKLIAFYFSAKQQNRRVKIRLNFISIQNNQAGGKENVCKLLAAVIENYPQLVKNADHNETVDIEAAGETIYLVLSQGPDKVIDLDHVMDHIRYCIQSITEDPSKCIELMKVYTGPNFKASIEKMRMEDQNNAELDIISDPPIKTHSNLVIWPSEYNPQKWMECFKKSNSVIHSLEQYKDSLEKKGFNGIRKTNKKNIEKMLNLDMIHPGDGLYLVRKKLQYAHVAIVTDTKSKKLVHATKTSIIILKIFREFGKIVEEIFDKVVKQEDECFVVRHQHKKLTGQHIAERASTLAIKPALTFTYDVIDANCEVVFNAAAGIFKAGRGSPQGQLVGEPYSDPRKKMIGWLLGWLQKSADIELLAQMYFRLDSHDMLYESEPGQQVKSIPGQRNNEDKEKENGLGSKHQEATMQSKNPEASETEAHKTYKLEDGDKFPFERLHSQNACILANAVYKDNPMEYLSASSTTHTIHTVCAISENSDQEVIVAVGKIESSNQNVLYVAFRGTSTWKDVVADANIQLKSKDTIPGGKVHSGFDKRASVLPLKQMLHCAKKEDCAIIVTCGHSMGGAISAISAIDLMLHLDKDSDMAIHNITFGMPLFANKTVKQTCTENKFEQNMLHYIGHKDVVPGILSLGHTITQLKSRAKALMNEATGGVSETIFQRWSTYLEKAAKLGSYVLQLLPWETNDVKSDIQILCDLGSKILDDIKDTELGQRYSPDEFVPIGNYFVIEHDSLSLLESSKITAQIQEVILKEPMRKVKDISDISKGHNLEDNYCANLIQILKLSSRSKRTPICKNLLQPESRDETARLIFTKRQEGTVGCTLLVAGSFLQNVQLHKINFEDLPFNASSTHNIQDFEDHEMLMISETSSNDVKRTLIDAPSLSLKLMTPFGGISVKVHVKTAKHVQESNMMKETVSSIIEKSILRCLMVSSLLEGSGHNAEMDQLAMTVEYLVHMLSDEDVETYKTIQQGSTSQEESVQKIKSLSQNIIQLCTQGIKYPQINTNVEYPQINTNVENEYYAQLRCTCDKVLKYSASVAKGDTVLEDLQAKLNLEEQQDNKEIEEEETEMKKKQGFLTNIFIYSGLDTKTRTNILNRRMNKKIFLKESILSHLHTTNGGKTSKLTEKIPSDTGKLFVQLKVECFLAIHELRFVFSKQCFIGFVGPQNAGKSTLLNALFNKRVETGTNIHTYEATKYFVAENIFAVDFPGFDSLFTHKERFSQLGRINNFFVYVMQYNGTPSEELVQNVKMAYEMEMCAGKSAKTLFCINKAAREEVVFDKAYKTKFVRMIKDNIKENDFSEEESLMKKWSDGLKNRVAKTVGNEAYDEIKAKYKELKEYTIKNLKEDDFIFTDWKQQDTNLGIEGPEDVRKRIKNYLVEAKVRSEDNLDDI